MSNVPYSMSFTSGTLLHEASLAIADLYAQLGDWQAVRDHAVRENALHMRTDNANRRITREVVSRLRLLTVEQLEMLRTMGRRDQHYILWLAVCKRYQFIADFGRSTLREKYLSGQRELTYADFATFFETQAALREKVARVAASTRAKQRQVIFKMLREAELISAENHILPATPAPRLLRAIGRDHPDLLTIYPIADSTLRDWVNA